MTNIINNLFDESKGLAVGRNRLKGRRILIVGGGQMTYGLEDEPVGNGRAMSILFAREGATVVVSDINESAALETVNLIKEEGYSAFGIKADASKDKEMQMLINKSKGLMGGLDGIVLNLGIVKGQFFESTSVEDWDQAFAVNVRSHFLGCKYGMPEMEEGGAIVLISSVAEKFASVEVPSYSSSKAALKGICIHAAREGAPNNIRCNIVAPGLIDTSLGRFASKNRPSRNQTKIPLGRQGTAWEVAYLANFLISNESSYITGQSFTIDGGLTLQ